MSALRGSSMVDESQQDRATLMAAFRVGLLTWFLENRRSFIWRETSDPWLILISEILLKRTLAGRVNAFIPEFVKKYTDPSDLVAANQKDLERDLAPLGLQKQRVTQLKALSRVLVEDFGGCLPQSKEDLARLPGLGDYGRNAVLCFAYGKSFPIIDGNVIRVLLRVFPINYSRARARYSPEVWELAWNLLPETADEVRDFNLALLDLGALVCLPRYPKCRECPLLTICTTGREQVVDGVRRQKLPGTSQ
jgi:A/G-specific adenine glycosylase